MESFRETPLHLAAQYGHPDVVALLLERGATVDAANSIGRTPLYNATMCDSYRNRANVMRLLIKGGANPNYRTIDGDNALRMAANHEHLDAFQILLDAGIDVNNRDENGETVLHQVVTIWNPVPMMRLLLKHGADPNVIDSVNLCTPLLYLEGGGWRG